MMNEDNKQEIKELIRRLKQDNPYIEKSIFRSIHAVCLDTFPGYKTEGKEHSFLEKYNNCLFGKVSVNLAGDVTPCPMMNDYVIGNIKDDPIDKILAQEKYQNVIKMTKNETEKCSECAFRMNCVDCRSLEYAATDRINGVKYCKYVK